MAKLSPAVESLIDDKVKDALEDAGLDVIAGPVGPGMAGKGPKGIGEQVRGRLHRQWREYTDNIIQAGKSTRDFFVGITKGTHEMDKHASMVT